MKTIVIADDHPVTLNGMKAYVERLGYIVPKIFDNGITAYNHIMVLNPDCVLLDLNMPGMNGLEVLEKIRADNKTMKVVIYTMYQEKSIFEKALKLGVNGYLLKDFALQELEACLKALSTEKFWFSPKLEDKLIISDAESADEKVLLLTPAERKIASLIAHEHSSKTIAEMLYISEKTVENHRSNIIKKLNLPNTKNALITWALKSKQKLM